MSVFDENTAFVADPAHDAMFVHFQTMKGGHAFHTQHLWRFGGFLGFGLGNPRRKRRTALLHTLNSVAAWVLDRLVHERYLLWLVWNHVGYFSWRRFDLQRVTTSVDAAGLPDMPAVIAQSLTARYGPFHYARYFEYEIARPDGQAYLFKVYWVIERARGTIVVVEETDYWVGRLGFVIDVTFAPAERVQPRSPQITSATSGRA